MPQIADKAREDLEYVEQEIDGDQIVFVHDPIRGTYCRFNALQGAMLRALDGRHTPDEIVAVLSEQFEVEIPPAAAERFIARARELMLLEISSYSDTSERARERVRKALHKAGFRWPASFHTDASGDADAALMAHAFHELEHGHPRAAAGYLAELLEHAPENARARQLYDLIRTAYIRAAGGTDDAPTWVLFNPSRMLNWFDRRIGGFLFSARGVLAILLFVLAGVYAYIQISFDHITLGVADIAFAILVFQIQNLLHELGHGLACQHYGGNVTEIGLVLLHGVKLSQYCDTSSSYLITNRRHKMVVQIAGTVVSLIFMAAVALLLLVIRPTLPVYSALAISLIIGLAGVWVTLIPFLKFDGYYAICDYFGFPNLRDRSFKVTRAWLAERLLGLTLPTEDLPPRTRAWLKLYALLSFLFTVWFVYFVLVYMLTPLVERFRGPGLVLATLIAAFLLRKHALAPLWSFARALLRERRRIFTPRRAAVLLGLAAMVIAPWFIRWPVLVDGELVVRPLERADVRAQTAGRIVEIFVKEGDRVQRGQPLATLRNPELHAQVEQLTAELEAASHHLDQVTAGAREEELALARTRLERARSQDRRRTKEATIASQLADASLATQSSADAAGRRASASASGPLQWALALLNAGTRREEIAAAQADCVRLSTQLQHLRTEQELLTLHSPIDGNVVMPHLADKLQMALAPGDLFAEIHDTSAVIAEVSLALSDPLAEIAVGDDVELRPYGAPHADARARVDRIREVAQASGDAAARKIVVVTSPFALQRRVSGLTGHARIYGAEHSLAYAYLYLPLQRLIRVRLWSMW